MSIKINFTENGTNFDSLHSGLMKPTKTVTTINQVIPTFSEQYLKLFDYYIENINSLEKDTVRLSVIGGVVDLEREPVKALSQTSVRYLVRLDTLNNKFFYVAVSTKQGYKFLSASSYKRTLTEIKKHALSILEPEKKIFFENWYKKNAPVTYIGKTLKYQSLNQKKKEPLILNNGYYTRLIGKLMITKSPKTAMLVMEMLTGRRVAECNIANFEWLDTKDIDVRKKIVDTYSITNGDIIDRFSWVNFSGQLKIKNASLREESYPIPLLIKMSEPEFKYWGELVAMQVEDANIANDYAPNLWASQVGGVRRLRGYTEKLHKKLIPDLDKAHNFRAIYGSIISNAMLESCKVSDNVQLMTILLGHIDFKSTDKYRNTKVINSVLTSTESDLINNLEEVVEAIVNPVRLNGNIKAPTEFINWRAADKKHYDRYIKNPEHFNNLNVITNGTVDFSTFSKMTAEDFRSALDKIFDQLVADTGLSYRLLTTRYDDTPFTVLYNLAKKIYTPGLTVSTQTLKKNMDREYARYVTDMQEISEEEIVVEQY